MSAHDLKGLVSGLSCVALSFLVAIFSLETASQVCCLTHKIFILTENKINLYIHKCSDLPRAEFLENHVEQAQQKWL